MARQKEQPITNVSDLLAHDRDLDRTVCGFSLAEERETRYAIQGAHDVSPTFYFVLDELLGQLSFDEHSHLLDVGCSTGRVLAYFVRRGLPGKATGVELDTELADVAARWTAHYDNLDIIAGSVLDIDLDAFTHIYMFNPFSPWVLQKFIAALEAQLTHPLTLVHMSDNGDTWQYVGRSGWTELSSGEIQDYINARGFPVRAYDNPQHYSIWRYEP